MNIAICDDEQTVRINLYRYLDDYFRNKRIEPSITFSTTEKPSSVRSPIPSCEDSDMIISTIWIA